MKKTKEHAVGITGFITPKIEAFDRDKTIAPTATLLLYAAAFTVTLAVRGWLVTARYGADWHATDKSNRLAEANAALSTSTAATPAPAAPPAASQPAPASASASASAPDLRAWCRQRYGNDRHSIDKTARLAEARAQPSHPAMMEPSKRLIVVDRFSLVVLLVLACEVVATPIGASLSRTARGSLLPRAMSLHDLQNGE
ncbi:hypothetical protein EMIHUDRAFT_216379 [Emiliania huxleyi CCMP1516]|uniref:Uncharacterized protein n=2 Tax=Emiliania huxleyi TaxID=2903 RepID=A0A0D3IEV5_EMIH1|nr:hypothetical protein EMIHUDRAFT_216379 [Emiliania huxleyi CCMP1516]EOD09790.1 hypothetical protein EMIHUDRAFT_216379 [Emiliania huxleyi CCMP1516]|eukprot:XP_005762219.1 hypothetical protein EMIHUDRAFT_216379 [Emiliania huxleyi CCMP1516]